MNDRDGATPRSGRRAVLWHQVADALEHDILSKVYPPGSRLPTEADLAARFGVNRHTLRRAVAVLQDQGLIRVEQGRGTFVQEDVIEYPLARRTRFSEIVGRQARTPSGKLLRSVSIPADAVVADRLGVAIGDAVALIETIGMADDAPLSLARHHFPLARFPDLFSAYREGGTVTDMLRRLGVEDYFRKTTRLTSRMPDEYEMRHLRLSKTVPVLVLESVNVDSDDTVLEFGITRFAASRVQIVIDTL